jgi:hypothetical protein
LRAGEGFELLEAAEHVLLGGQICLPPQLVTLVVVGIIVIVIVSVVVVMFVGFVFEFLTEFFEV